VSSLLESATAILQIILINVVLSGDNAIVIALATRQLPARQRRSAMFWGTFAAVGLRLVLTVVVSQLMALPGLRFLGALLLGWIACELVSEDEEGSDRPELVSHSMRTAIFRIVVADLVMSLDNVVAIAAISKSNLWHLLFGLFVSIGIILAFSTAILALMNRFRWITFAGAAVLGVTAFRMMLDDLDEFDPVAWLSADRYHLAAWGKWALCVLSLGAVGALRLLWPRLRAGRRARPVEAREHPLDV
jgi:YjbE family integral membrane protein